jgi:uncharacterized protein YaiE (UPF0345 family)
MKGECVMAKGELTFSASAAAEMEAIERHVMSKRRR